MGVFQRYNKKDKDGNIIIGKDGRPVKEGPWFVQYPHSRDPETGKIKYRTEKGSFAKKKAEKKFRAKVDAFQEMEQFGIQIDTEMTFDQLMTWGLEQVVMRSKVSAADDVTRVKHLNSFFKNRIAIQVTPLEVENFRKIMIKTKSQKTGRNFSGTSVNKLVSLARRIYYLAMDQGIVQSNPFARRGCFKEEPKGSYISLNEFLLIEKHVKKNYMIGPINTGYYTGMRRSEYLDLTWSSVDMKEYYIDLTSDQTKTSEPRRIFFGSIKKLKNIFIEAERKRQEGQELVFIKDDGSPVPKWYIQRLFKQACKDAGVKPYRLHDLRHTFNTNMLKSGVSQAVIMKLTGHKTNEMFLRYAHLDNEQGIAAMGKLNGYLESINKEVESVSG